MYNECRYGNEKRCLQEDIIETMKNDKWYQLIIEHMKKITEGVECIIYTRTYYGDDSVITKESYYRHNDGSVQVYSDDNTEYSLEDVINVVDSCKENYKIKLTRIIS